MSATNSKKFRLQGKQLFLTYPQCILQKELVLTKVVALFKQNLVFAIVAQENHQSGDKHLHIVVSLSKRIDWKSMKKMDDLTGKRGNYQTCRSLIATVKYVVKDGHYCAHGVDVEEYLKQVKMKKSTQFALTVMQHGIDQVNELDPGFVLMNLQKLQAYHAYTLNLKEKKNALSLSSYRADYAGTNLSIIGITGWLNQNLFASGSRTFKSPQLYIHGDPNSGKTTLINNLVDLGVRVYYLPSESYYCTYDDDAYDLIILDEFKAQKKIQELNRWLDGSQFPVARKGTFPFLKKKNLPFIILSNYSVAECYKNTDPHRLAPLDARLLCYHVSEFIDIKINKFEQEEIQELSDCDSEVFSDFDDDDLTLSTPLEDAQVPSPVFPEYQPSLNWDAIPYFNPPTKKQRINRNNN